VVEKLAGSININVIKTGVQSSHRDDWKVTGVSFFLDKYRATKTIKTTKATVEVWKEIPIKGTFIHLLAFAPAITVPLNKVIANKTHISGNANTEMALK
jgi:hypothetical protein